MAYEDIINLDRSNMKVPFLDPTDANADSVAIDV